MTDGPALPVPTCPACSEPGSRWEITSPVAAEDRVLVEPEGMTELGLFTPDDGIEPLGRPVIRCAACRAVAAEPLADLVLQAAAGAGKSRRTPGDA